MLIQQKEESSMVKRKKILYGLLLAGYHRDAGSAEISGKTVKWKEGDFIRFIENGDDYGNVLKLPVHLEYVRAVFTVLEDLHWGQFIKVALIGKEVIDIEPIDFDEEL